MKTPKRGRLEILLEILDVIKKGESKPTKIMYASNLSWNILTPLLAQLEALNLITRELEEEDHRSHKRYKITDEGEAFLKQQRELLDAIRKATPTSYHPS